MNSQQNAILWIGLFLVVAYLFTDQNFRSKLFGRTKSNIPTVTAFTLADITGVPSSTGNTHSNTGNTGSAIQVMLCQRN